MSLALVYGSVDITYFEIATSIKKVEKKRHPKDNESTLVH